MYIVERTLFKIISFSYINNSFCFVLYSATDYPTMINCLVLLKPMMQYIFFFKFSCNIIYKNDLKNVINAKHLDSNKFKSFLKAIQVIFQLQLALPIYYKRLTKFEGCHSQSSSYLFPITCKHFQCVVCYYCFVLLANIVLLVFTEQ